MKKVNKVDIKKLIVVLIFFIFCCIIIAIILYQGQYLQNYINSPYSPQSLLLIKWIILHLFFALALFLLWSLGNRKNFILFTLSYFLHIFRLVSIYCFANYLLSFICSVISLFVFITLLILNIKEKNKLIIVVLILYSFLIITSLFSSIIYYSLEFGIWKD